MPESRSLGAVDNIDNSTSLAIPNISLANRYNTPQNFEHLNLPILQAFYSHQFSDHMRLRQAIQYQHVGDEYWQSEFLSIDSTPPAPEVDRSYLYFNHDSNGFVSQTDLLADFHYLGDHKFTRRV